MIELIPLEANALLVTMYCTPYVCFKEWRVLIVHECCGRVEWTYLGGLN